MAKPNSCPLCTGRWAPPHPFSKLLTHLDPSIESPWPLPSRALRIDLYLCRFGWENGDLKMGKYHSKEPGPFHVTKMKDANTRWKDKHEGKRRYHENVSFSLRISVYPRVSHTFYTESFSQKHWGRKNVRKLLWHTRSKPLNFFNKRSLKKKPWTQGLSITTPARSPQCSTQQTMTVYGQSAFHETRSHFS